MIYTELEILDASYFLFVVQILPHVLRWTLVCSNADVLPVLCGLPILSNSRKRQPVRTKFGTRTGQQGDNVQEIVDDSARPEVFCLVDEVPFCKFTKSQFTLNLTMTCELVNGYPSERIGSVFMPTPV